MTGGLTRNFPKSRLSIRHWFLDYFFLFKKFFLYISPLNTKLKGWNLECKFNTDLTRDFRGFQLFTSIFTCTPTQWCNNYQLPVGNLLKCFFGKSKICSPSVARVKILQNFEGQELKTNILAYFKNFTIPPNRFYTTTSTTVQI